MKFVSLHNHSEFSLTDSPAAPKAYAARAAEMGFSSIALTDHGSLSGSMKFMGECKLVDVKPILGCEFYVREDLVRDEKRQHILALARNKNGWQQLLKLNKFGAQHGFYYRPRITLDLLKENCSDLIVSSACIQSPFADFLKDNCNIAAAMKLAFELQEATKGNFYFELIFNNLEFQKVFNSFILGLAHKSGIPFIVTNDVHYIKRDDAILRQIIWGIGRRYDCFRLGLDDISDDIYLKTPDEIWATVEKYGYEMSRDEFDAGVERTLEVAEKIDNYEITLGRYAIPSFCPTKKESDDNVGQLCRTKLVDISIARGYTLADYTARLERELSVISEKNFSDYFLIMRDIILFCRQSGIYYGVGRGSVVGSLVAYLLEITRLDPIKYDLMFERFLSRSRKEPPDIDMDFDSDRRDEVEAYIRQKYGDANVGHVFTTGTFGTRGVVRDIGRVFILNQDHIDRLTKCMHDDKSVVTEAKRIRDENAQTKESAEFVKFLDENQLYWGLAERLRGRLRHYGLHASGVVIDDSGLQSIPVLRVKDQIVCALQEGADEREISEMGLIKFDILGLTACTVISNALKFIKRTTGKDLEKRLDNFDFDHQYASIMKRFNTRDTVGVFQFSSPGMRDFAQRVGVKTFDDLVVINALYRPANLVSGEAEEYIRRKNENKAFELIDPRLEPILGKTYGCIVFQEQILQLLHVIGGLSLEEADEIRALFKKYYQLGITEANNITRKKMEDFKQRVMEKWRVNGMSEENAEHLYGLINHYTKYAFNKSHATAYSYIAFQTMWLKENYPAQFYAAALNAEIDDEDKVAEIRRAILREKKRGIEIYFEPPKINKSEIKFTLEPAPDGKAYAIREGFLSIKGIGMKAAEEIVKVFPAKDYPDFVSRVNKRVVNKRVMEKLHLNFAFSELEGVPNDPQS